MGVFKIMQDERNGACGTSWGRGVERERENVGLQTPQETKIHLYNTKCEVS